MLGRQSVHVEVSLPSDREIVFTCRFHRSARLLFEAWTKPEHIRGWWGCEGSSITRCAVDLRVGGSWSLAMRMADGSEHPFHGIYREIVPSHRLLYTECYQMPRFGNPEWLTTVTFHQAPASTLVTHTILHKTREARDGHLQAGMEPGMVQRFTQLDEVVTDMERSQPLQDPDQDQH